MQMIFLYTKYNQKRAFMVMSLISAEPFVYCTGVKKMYFTYWSHLLKLVVRVKEYQVSKLFCLSDVSYRFYIVIDLIFSQAIFSQAPTFAFFII